ncbi:hypothetical protein [Sporomusa silvacetica]|nr:hypothetical protein [Sporomusa silvacetica]
MIINQYVKNSIFSTLFTLANIRCKISIIGGARMSKQSEISDEKITVGARVSAEAVGVLKQYEIPISDVIEAGILYFLCLDDADKVAYYLKNSFDVVDRSDYKIPHTTWPECIKEILNLSKTVDVKTEVKNFRAAAKWMPDKGEARISQLKLKNLTIAEIIKKADELTLGGRVQETIPYYDYAIMLSTKLGSPQITGEVYLKLGDASRDMGNFSLALSAYAFAEQNFEKEATPQNLADLSYSRGVCFQLWGKHTESYAYLKKARELYDSIGDADNLFKTHSRLSISLDSLETKDAVEACNEVLAYFTQLRSQFIAKIDSSANR